MATVPSALKSQIDTVRPILGDTPKTNLPTKSMKYGAQVVWCVYELGNGTMNNADGLHGKAVAAGDGAKSAIVKGRRPSWPVLTATSGDLRLFVVGHGTSIMENDIPVEVKLEVGAATYASAQEFFEDVRALVQQAPGGRVKRISLAMCDSAGLDGVPGQYEGISLLNSFAQNLANLASGLTIDVTGRRGAVAVRRSSVASGGVDGLNEDYKAAGVPKNPLHQMMQAGQMVSVVNAWKQVDGRAKYRTYVFQKDKAPELKTDAEGVLYTV